jgi:hypothetical protein
MYTQVPCLTRCTEAWTAAKILCQPSCTPGSSSSNPTLVLFFKSLFIGGCSNRISAPKFSDTNSFGRVILPKFAVHLTLVSPVRTLAHPKGRPM